MPVTGADMMSPLAERYVRLVLAVGQHDADFVDAYYGPPAWKPAPRHRLPLDWRPGARSRTLLTGTSRRRRCPPPPLERLRRDYLIAQTERDASRASDAQRRAADVRRRVARRSTTPSRPPTTRRTSATRLKTLDGLLPGAGPLAARVEAFRQRFVIPPDKLDAVFRAAVDACRAADRRAPAAARRRAVHDRVRHRQVVERLQLVPGQLPQPDPGQHRPADLHRPRAGSRVPRGLSRAPRLQRAARASPRARARMAGVHGLPAVLAPVAHRRGHGQLRHRGGAIPAAERVAFERERLFPLAGLDPADAPKYYEVHGLARPADLCRQRGGAPLSRRRDQRVAGRRVAR